MCVSHIISHLVMSSRLVGVQVLCDVCVCKSFLFWPLHALIKQNIQY
jgi:hypothetical protein